MLNITSLVRIYGRRRLRKLAAMNAADVQQRQLLGLVARASRTTSRRDHDFKSIRSVTEFQAGVPLRQYEDFRERYWGNAFPGLRAVTRAVFGGHVGHDFGAHQIHSLHE